MADLIVEPDLWISRMLPEGIVEKWLVADGASVASNDPVADLRIENQLRRLKSPEAGRLTIYAHQNSIVEPGTVIGKVEAA
jgi:pyruvate/2-oxoglutarate dehydrogenase complex dihydrolipoamide acyltransferase (E2) component